MLQIKTSKNTDTIKEIAEFYNEHNEVTLKAEDCLETYSFMVGEEVTTEMLGVDTFSESGLNEGQMILASAFDNPETEDCLIYILYENDNNMIYIYSTLSVAEDGSFYNIVRY